MMSSHFASIGLPVRTDDDLIALAERVSATEAAIPTRRGHYRRWCGESGAELWVQFDLQGALLGMNPHFNGGGSIEVGLLASLQRPPSVLDGAFRGVAAPTSQNIRDGVHSLAFDCPNFAICEDAKLPSRAEIQLAAFAHELRLFESAEQYDEATAGDDTALSAQDFIPSGLMQTRAEVPPTLALLSGHIRRAEMRRNELSGEAFYALSLQSRAGTIDVVADVNAVTEKPHFGGVAVGSFWLSGRLLRYQRGRPSFIRRLLTPPAPRKAGANRD